MLSRWTTRAPLGYNACAFAQGHRGRQRRTGAPQFHHFFRIDMKNLLQPMTLGLVMAFAGSLAYAQTPLVGNPLAAENKVDMCTGCHALPDYKASYPEVYRIPMIGGQNEKYIENALHEYQKGERIQPSMQAIAASLSDQDIADIAAYFSQK